MYKKILFFIGAVLTAANYYINEYCSAGLFLNAFVLVICLFGFSDMHFKESKIYPKSIGVIYILGIMSSLVIPLVMGIVEGFDEIGSWYPFIACNILLTKELDDVRLNVRKTLFENNKSRFGYVWLSFIFTLLTILTTLCIAYIDNKLILYICSYAYILFVLYLSLKVGRYFINRKSQIKGYYSYSPLILTSLLLTSLFYVGFFSYFILLYLDIQIDVFLYILFNLAFVVVFLIFLIIYEIITRKKIKYKACQICGSLNPNEDEICSTCKIEFENITPICPNCGKTTNSTSQEYCSECNFNLYEYFSQKFMDKKYCILNVVTTKEKSLYKLAVQEGMYVSNYSKILVSKDDDIEINIFGEPYKSESTEEPISGYIHVYYENKKFAWCIYSPAVFSNTHKDYQKKLEREKLAEERRKQDEEEARIAEEQERLRKIREEEKRTEEERIKKEQEQEEARRQYIKAISEQTGIILD